MSIKLNIQDTFNKELPADPSLENVSRQVSGACFSYVSPRIPTKPKLIHCSTEMAEALGLNVADTKDPSFERIFSGADKIPGTKPYAMCYGGHQFGSWAGQLGDGRAINLGEVVHADQRWAMQLKGAGATPYSRHADGLAVLRSSVREHLCSEAMYHLGVPTTRSLSLALTGDEVMRDMLYDGNSAYEKGAVVCRVAPSFIRFGNFQIFAAQKDDATLKALLDYTLTHFFPDIKGRGKEDYLEFYRRVNKSTLEMILHWQRVGFVHGVMNTDNMSILGLTIDYGPYGWLEGYDHTWTPNTTDAQGRRYRFGNQPSVGLWNLLQLGNALVPLINDIPAIEEILQAYQPHFHEGYAKMMRQKLGLASIETGDDSLFKELEEVLQVSETDMTIFFRNLSLISNGDITASDAKGVKNAIEKIKPAYYTSDETTSGDSAKRWENWFRKYLTRLKSQVEKISAAERHSKMNAVNPKYVLRNYMAQLAIDKADAGDYSLIDELHQLLKKPYHEQPEQEMWFAKRPEWARNKVGCSMLSCSS